MERLIGYSALAALLLVSACGKQNASDKEARLSPVGNKKQEQKTEGDKKIEQGVGEVNSTFTNRVTVHENLAGAWRQTKGFNLDQNCVMASELPTEAGKRSLVRFAGVSCPDKSLETSNFDLYSELKSEEKVEGQKASKKTYTLIYKSKADQGKGKDQQQVQVPQEVLVGEMVLETYLVEQQQQQGKVEQGKPEQKQEEVKPEQGQVEQGKPEQKQEEVKPEQGKPEQGKPTVEEHTRLVLTKLCSDEYAGACEVQVEKGLFSGLSLTAAPGSDKGKQEQEQQGKPEQKQEVKPEQKQEEVKPEQGKPEQKQEVKPEQKQEEVKPEQGKPEQKQEEVKPEQVKPEQGQTPAPQA